MWRQDLFKDSGGTLFDKTDRTRIGSNHHMDIYIEKDADSPLNTLLFWSTTLIHPMTLRCGYARFPAELIFSSSWRYSRVVVSVASAVSPVLGTTFSAGLFYVP